MINFLIEGGPIFTFPMTLIFLANVVLMARNASYLFKGKFNDVQGARGWIDPIKYIGVFLLTIGILGQIIGLYGAFQAIESRQVEVTPWLMAAGIRVSSITTLLGFTYFLISYLVWFFLNLKLNRNMHSS